MYVPVRPSNAAILGVFEQNNKGVHNDRIHTQLKIPFPNRNNFRCRLDNFFEVYGGEATQTNFCKDGCKGVCVYV